MNKYWDIDDLLITNEKIQTIIETDITGLDFIEKANNHNNDLDIVTIQEGVKLDFPIWIATILKSLNLVSFAIPKYLGEKFYHQIIADSVIINIKDKHPYFYDIIMKLIPYIESEIKWPETIADCFQSRYLHLYKNSCDVQYENQSIIKNLCWREKEFYEYLIKTNRNMKFFIENYLSNNKNLEEYNENKRASNKKKKIK